MVSSYVLCFFVSSEICLSILSKLFFEHVAITNLVLFEDQLHCK